jgi:redox-sensitive bicupin YhaK (pirin superfamily)
MPAGDQEGRMGGFQLWANLPQGEKMCDPHYQGFEEREIPEHETEEATVRVVCGDLGDASGPVRGIATDPEYLDVTLRAGKEWAHPTPQGHTVFAYVVDGEVEFGEGGEAQRVPDRHVVLFEGGHRVVARAGAESGRFLLVSGRPLGEPIAWRGPIVMNTDDELRTAFREVRDGTFVKHGAD